MCIRHPQKKTLHRGSSKYLMHQKNIPLEPLTLQQLELNIVEPQPVCGVHGVLELEPPNGLLAAHWTWKSLIASLVSVLRPKNGV